jgi:hypothetical protein
MNKTTVLGLVAAGALVATTGLAQTQQNPQPKGQQMQQHGQGQQGTGRQGQGQQGQQGQAQQGQQSLAQEQLDGRIVDVDKDKGTISIQTAQHGQLDFKLTQAQIQRLNEGDQIRVQILLQPMPKQP